MLFRLLCPFSISSSYSLLRVNTDLLSSDIIGISNTDDAGEKVQDTAIAVAVQGTESGTDISAHSISFSIKTKASHASGLNQ